MSPRIPFRSAPERAVARTPVRPLVAFVVAAVSVAVLAASTPGSAGAVATDTRAKRAAVRAEQAKVAAQVDAMESSQAQVIAALNALDQNVRGQQAMLVDARQQAETAGAEAAVAEAAAQATSVELEALRERVARYAVQSYVSPPSEDLMRRFQASSAQEDATRQALLDMQSRNDSDVIDQLRATKARLEEELARARQARADAERHMAEAESALAQLESARSQQQAFAAQVRLRLDERLADAAYLSQIDAQFGAQIAAEEAELIRAVRPVQPAPTNPEQGAGGTTTTPPTTTPPTTTPPTTSPTPRITPHDPLTTVGGITVAVTIAEDLRGLLAAASAAGFRLGGYGYRDINVQIQLRRQNCGTSTYAIWEMPADACSPPTARPGLSMHERGLAVDFTSNGSFITSRSNPAFIWLSANASRFGFVGLASEPWHWSNPG